MAVTWYRLCFQPSSTRDNFADRDAFADWCSEHFSMFEYTTAGYIIQPAHHGVSKKAGPWWNILLPGKIEYQSGEPDIIRYLSEQHWDIDGYHALLYIKHGSENEILYPIRGGKNVHSR